MWIPKYDEDGFPVEWTWIEVTDKDLRKIREIFIIFALIIGLVGLFTN